jgi:ligand-binding sensor domain-containing protein
MAQASSSSHFCLWQPNLAILFLLWLALPVAAQRYRFDQWTTDHGLPQNTIRNVIQTRDGYLWMTTFDGLVRFDGVRFTVFSQDNTPGIVNNRFFFIHESSDGTIYAGFEMNGITVYRNGRFKSYTPANGFPQERLVVCQKMSMAKHLSESTVIYAVISIICATISLFRLHPNISSVPIKNLPGPMGVFG